MEAELIGSMFGRPTVQEGRPASLGTQLKDLGEGWRSPCSDMGMVDFDSP